MPSIKDFDSKKRERKSHVSEKAHKQEAASGQRPKRRPGRPDTDEGSDVIYTEQAAEYVSTTTSINEKTNDSNSPKDQFHLEFFGSDLLREKAPKTFELARAVAEEWVKDGDFRTLPLDNPWAQVAASQGLQQMKKVEKKLEEIGLISLAQMGLALVKAKLKIK